jgi:hypothetical protein
MNFCIYEYVVNVSVHSLDLRFSLDVIERYTQKTECIHMLVKEIY